MLIAWFNDKNSIATMPTKLALNGRDSLIVGMIHHQTANHSGNYIFNNDRVCLSMSNVRSRVDPSA
jgi:hypothetical protein